MASRSFSEAIRVSARSPFTSNLQLSVLSSECWAEICDQGIILCSPWTVRMCPAQGSIRPAVVCGLLHPTRHKCRRLKHDARVGEIPATAGARHGAPAEPLSASPFTNTSRKSNCAWPAAICARWPPCTMRTSCPGCPSLCRRMHMPFLSPFGGAFGARFPSCSAFASSRKRALRRAPQCHSPTVEVPRTHRHTAHAGSAYLRDQTHRRVTRPSVREGQCPS